ALIHDPPVVLADEPTGNLDSATSEQVLSLLRNLARERNATIIMATHSTKAARFADTVYALRNGRLVVEPQCGS
ncbi:MAG: ABC transporter ATP-binding protein, partial [Gammaproteobacteria bacterium]